MQQVEKKKNYYKLGLEGGRLFRTSLTDDYLLVGQGGGNFYYLSPVFDTLEMGETFHRFQLEGEFYQCKKEIIVAATDRDLRYLLEDEKTGLPEIVETLKTCSYQRKVNHNDFLLHELTGRYVWILICISAARIDSSFEIEGFSVVFPKSSFIEYLPEVYQNDKDTFFYRYMAALQSLYVDLEEEVSKVPKYLDYQLVDDERLKILSNWVGLQGDKLPYTPEQLRKIMTDLGSIQSGKGTITILKKMIHMMTGKEPIIVEYFKRNDWMKYGILNQQYEKLYGEEPTSFSCILDFVEEKQDQIPSVEFVMKIINQFIPFGLHCNLVYLRENYNIDTHCYLDINSHLSTPEKADTAGFVLGGNYVLG
ncbi:MAG: hypothetical protein R3Y24_01715 [Eubacteriales bacterium]